MAPLINEDSYSRVWLTEQPHGALRWLEAGPVSVTCQIADNTSFQARSSCSTTPSVRARIPERLHFTHTHLNPFPAKAFVLVVKISSKNSLTEVLLARSVCFENFAPVWSAWQVGIEARGCTTSYGHAGTTLRKTSSDVTMAVNGLMCGILFYGIRI